MLSEGYRHLIVLGLLALVCIYSITYKPLENFETIRLDEIPPQFGDWTRIQDNSITESAYRALEPDGLLMREYKNSKNDQVSLTVVYHQNDRWGAHDPAVCHESQGWTVLPERTRDIDLGSEVFEVNEFLVSKGLVKRVVTYWWFTSGKRQMASRMDHMFYMSLSGILYGYTESGFVEVSAPVTSRGLSSTRAAIADFCNSFVPVLKSTIH